MKELSYTFSHIESDLNIFIYEYDSLIAIEITQ